MPEKPAEIMATQHKYVWLWYTARIRIEWKLYYVITATSYL